MRLPKDPKRSANNERNDAEANPEPPKPKRLPAQLRFSARESGFQVAVCFFQHCDALAFSRAIIFQDFSCFIGWKRQGQLLADLQIAIPNPGIVSSDFLLGNFER